MIKRILAIVPNTWHSEQAYAAVTVPAAAEACALIERASDQVSPDHYPEGLLPLMQRYDLIVADVSSDDPSAAYLLGCAHALNRPVVLLAPVEARLPIRATNQFAREAWLFAALKSPDSARPRIDQLRNTFAWALSDPESFLTSATSRSGRRGVFVSYAHQDTRYLSRLLRHLQPLESAGVLDVWADTKLMPGTPWRIEIDRALERARVAVLLLSADFMASTFVQEYELPALLAAAETRGTRILPLVVGPCGLERHTVLSGIQSLNDPQRPLMSLPEHEVEATLDQVASTLEGIVVGIRGAA